MAVRRPPTTFSDEISAADLAANSVGASELADNAVDTAAIADDAVTQAKVGASAIGATELASNAVTTAKITDANITAAKVASSAITKEKIAAEAIEVKPHIKYGILYPAIKDGTGTVRLSDGATAHSGAYGTAQSDGRNYYYTDIKGSKPIKDPRIGGHFGSQRHKFKSLQLLEQETATHGTNTYSIDGREWCRVVGNAQVFYGDHGHFIHSNEGGSVAPNFFVEIVGYFNDFNVISRTNPARVDDINVTVNGTTTNSSDTDKLGGKATANSPLRNRFVDSGSVINHGDSTVATNLGTTPKINTIKLEAINTGSEYWDFFGIELIAQDTTSTANKSKIQIPSQNVVSYGKKFTVSGTPHYDPFNGFVNDTTLFSSVVDTATSLGLGTATTWGTPWDKGSNDHIRPFNGGRVVKWVDSSGNIKTSVTMMPANAQNIGTTASNEITTASATNSHTINFSDDAVENSLSEVAKTYLWQEFGNGAANGGTGATYADASMLASAAADDIAYVMDDGLTSLSGTLTYDYASTTEDLFPSATDKWLYVTFIGTGISFYDEVDEVWESLAQNLPYGTHVMSFKRHSSVESSPIYIDNVQIKTEWFRFKEFAFHQPKKPPIPEDACILADYMLMADYVGVPSSDSGQHNTIPKGTRMCNSSRDIFYDTASGSVAGTYQNGIAVRERTFRIQYNDITASSKEGPIITYFGHPKMSYGLASDTDSSPKYELKIADSTTNVTGVTTSGSVSGANITGFKVDGTSYQHISSSKSDGTLGSQTAQIRAFPDDSNDNHLYMCDAYIPTPIHTSHHYQPFETPYLYELVGGDRNMEQTNLIVTPDGKSWDEVTRDTSYLGNLVLATSTDTGGDSSGNLKILDEWRSSGAHITWMNKDFAIAYDRVICLRDGQYVLRTHTISNCANADTHGTPKINGQEQYLKAYGWGNSGTARMNTSVDIPTWLKRGDYIQIYGVWYGDTDYSAFWIERIK